MNGVMGDNLGQHPAREASADKINAACDIAGCNDEEHEGRYQQDKFYHPSTLAEAV